MNRSVVLVWLGGAIIIGLLAVGVYRNRLVGAPPENVMQEACRNFQEATFTVNSNEFAVAVARTTEQKTLGLSGCQSLPERSGMYFVYEEAKEARFWMKDMVIPIDIIWIADGKVIGIEKSVPPPSEGQALEELPIYNSPGAINAVLEIESGAAGRLNIKPGDAVIFRES